MSNPSAYQSACAQCKGFLQQMRREWEEPVRKQHKNKWWNWLKSSVIKLKSCSLYSKSNLPKLSALFTQVRSYLETFRSRCNDVISWISGPNYFPGFTEGWATYVEHPLLTNDTDIYDNSTDKNVVLQKYGMLKYQVVMVKLIRIINLKHNCPSFTAVRTERC